MRRFCALILVLFVFQIAFSATYYSNNADLSILNNWWTSTDGSGTNPTNFTTSGDIFIVQSGQICSVNNSWSLANDIHILVFGTINVTGNSVINVGENYLSTGSFIVKSGGVFSNQTVGTISFHGSITIESGGTWTGSGATGNTININGVFTNLSALQIDNSTATYVFQNIGPRIYNAGLGFNIYNHMSSGINGTFSGKWYIRNSLITNALKMNPNAEFYTYGTFSSSSTDFSQSANSSIFHYAANIPLLPIQYGCKVQIDKGISVSLTSGNFFNFSDFILDTNSTVTISGTGYLHYLHFVTMNSGSTLFINNGIIPNNFNSFNNVYSATSTFRFGNNGSVYPASGVLLLYSDKQTFGNLVLENASSSTYAYVYNGNLTIQGNLVVGENVEFKAWPGFTYNVTVGGDITNNGTITTGVSSAINTIILNGAKAQNLNGTNSIIFYNLTINNSSSSGVTLNKSQTVINNLTLVDGIVYTSSSNILSLNNGSTSSIGSDTAHVDGPIKKVGNSAFTFPTGDKGVWARIQIIPVAGFDATTEISVEYIFSAAPYPSNLGLAINHVSFTEYWEIALISDPGNDATCNVTMYFNNMIRSGIVNSGIDITTTHYEGALWENKGGSFVDNYNNTGYITSTIPLTTYSPETIASSNGMSPLPIELLEFNAISTEFGIEIEWVTSSEKNNDYFTLERSVDGKKWVTIYTIRGVGNTNTIHEYNYTDKEKYPEYLYYRLKQNDFDGNFSYSKVISVNTTSILFPVFSSNYDKDSKQIRIFCIEEYQSKIEFIELINSLGQKVYKSNTFISKIDVTKFPKGIYYVYCKYPQSFSANRLFID